MIGEVTRLRTVNKAMLDFEKHYIVKGIFVGMQYTTSFIHFFVASGILVKWVTVLFSLFVVTGKF